MVDVAFRLLILWACQEQSHQKQSEAINAYFRDRETEWETGMPVLPGWAALGDVASQFGINDGADPFATPEDPN